MPKIMSLRVRGLSIGLGTITVPNGWKGDGEREDREKGSLLRVFGTRSSEDPCCNRIADVRQRRPRMLVSIIVCIA